jgi:hypothetical protein
MGYEVIYKFHERLPDGKYAEEVKETKKTVGKVHQEIPLSKLATVIMSQLARRDIWIIDVDIFEYTKKKISFKEPMDGKGLILKGKRFNITGLKLTSVVDVLYGKSIYGKDIYQRLTITGDDLQVLDYDSTLLQSVDILVNLRRNSNPDFPNLGRQTQLLVGSTRASFNFPIVDRDLKTVFASDDSLKDFQLTKLERVEDNVTISFQVYSRLNELQQLTRNI